MLAPILLLLLTIFSGCQKNSDNLVGTWKLSYGSGMVGTEHTVSLTFNANNTWSSTDTGTSGSCLRSGTYSVSGNKLTVVENHTNNCFRVYALPFTTTYKYSISEKTLRLTGVMSEVIYHK